MQAPANGAPLPQSLAHLIHLGRRRETHVLIKCFPVDFDDSNKDTHAHSRDCTYFIPLTESHTVRQRIFVYQTYIQSGKGKGEVRCIRYSCGLY